MTTAKTLKLKEKEQRPRRGTPEQTRARLVASAAEELNRVGYLGTDSNRLARAAGYAPATFYKHFPSKRDIFLAAYEAWVTAEWSAVEAELARGGTPASVADRIVDLVLGMHRRWRGLRAGLRVLVATDDVARDFYRAQRRRQLQTLAALRTRLGTPARRAEQDALLLFLMERVCDAVADGELRDIGVGVEPMIALLREEMTRHLSPPESRRR